MRSWILCLALIGCGGDANEPATGTFVPTSLAPPTAVSATGGPGQFTCHLSWTAPAQPVTSFEIVTSDGNDNMVPGTATEADIDFFGGELQSFQMKIRALDGNARSEYSPIVSCVLPMVGPMYPLAVVVSNGVLLQWSGTGLENEIEVERAPLDASGALGAWSSVALVPVNPFADLIHSYVDTTSTSVGVAYAYALTAIAPTGERGTGSAVITPPRGPALVDAAIQLPPAPIVVADGKGHFAMARLAGGATFLWSDGTTVSQSPTLAVQAFAPYVRLDAAGLPHTVYATPAASGVTLTHGWSDGTAWHEEPIAAIDSVPSSGLTFDLDAAGAPVVMWGVDNVHFQVATKAAGSWTVQSLDALIGPLPGDLGLVPIPFTVFTDGTGVVHIVIATTTGLRHLQRTGTTWTSETAFPVSAGAPFAMAGTDPDHLVLCASFSSFDQPACVRKTSAGWGGLEQLGLIGLSLLPSFGVPLVGQAAMSADGKQVAVMFQSPGQDPALFRSTGGGAWTETAFAAFADTDAIVPTATIGFDGSQKLFMLVDPTAASDAGQASVAYRFSHAP
jgi:hypothetical protein